MITDELREFMRGADGYELWCPRHKAELTAIADRIDAEHERQCAESWMRGHDAWAAIDRSDEMAEHGWVRLPKDADGEYIHIGDVMEIDGEVLPPVSGIGNGSVIVGVFGVDKDDDISEVFSLDLMRHHRPDTWERIIRDAYDAGVLGETFDLSAAVARCKALCERTKEVGE